ncbi:MAG: 2TM domain-containing protein [Promethearchaeota archaeon]
MENNSVPEKTDSLPKSDSIDEKHLRLIARRRVIKRLWWSIDVLSYLFVIVILIIINYLTNKNYLWCLWVIAGWAVLLGFHYFGSFHAHSSAFKWHLFSFCDVNAFLIFAYFFTSAGKYPWILWPFGAWAMALLTHGVVHFIFHPRNGEDASKSWLERQVEKEIEKAIDENPNLGWICPKCGKKIMRNSIFCPNCGYEKEI